MGDSGGSPLTPEHDWERVYNDAGEALMVMKCAACGRVWRPHQTMQQMGQCRGPQRFDASVKDTTP